MKITIDASVLRPCPFCGGTDLALTETIDGGRYVRCRRCDTFGPTAKSVEDAVERWNTRKEERGEVKEEIILVKCLPCPFCGGDELRVEESKTKGNWHVWCLDCGALKPFAETTVEVIEKRNTRKEEKCQP